VVEAGARKQGGSDTQRRRGREAKKKTAKEEGRRCPFFGMRYIVDPKIEEHVYRYTKR
jgi:hypothetical protein